jgi:2-hydroxychromene-2-carboxylate isomerase
MKLRFFYDVVCPYAYLASQRVTDLAQRTGAELEWCPVLLGGLYRHHGGDQVPAQGWAHNKIQIGAKDLARQAAIHKVALTHNSLHPQRSVDAMRLILSAPQHTQVALTHALFRAYWVEGANINDSELLDSIAKSFDVDPTRRNTQAIKQELHYRTAAAADLGAFGVPAFEVGGKLWWGQDRMHFVEKALGGDPSLATDVGLSAKQDNGTLTFYHDFSSPYAYLAATQLEKQMTPLGHHHRLAPHLARCIVSGHRHPRCALVRHVARKDALSAARHSRLGGLVGGGFFIRQELPHPKRIGASGRPPSPKRHTPTLPRRLG